MKQHTIGTFRSRRDAERAINAVHNELGVPTADISYLYRNDEGTVREIDASRIASDTPAEGASKGARAGAVVGGLAGLAVAAGVIPVVGPLLAAGPILAALGITGTVGTAAAGAISGAAVGGLIGALVNLGVGKERALAYQDRVMAGDILVAVDSMRGAEVESVMLRNAAADAETFVVRV